MSEKPPYRPVALWPVANAANPLLVTQSNCRHESIGRFASDVCDDCNADVGDCSSAEICALCDYRVAVVGVHRLGDVAVHITLTRPFDEDARCLECVVDDLTRLVVAPAGGAS